MNSTPDRAARLAEIREHSSCDDACKYSHPTDDKKFLLSEITRLEAALDVAKTRLMRCGIYPSCEARRYIICGNCKAMEQITRIRTGDEK